MSLNQFITHIKQVGLVTGSKFEVIVPFVDGTSNTTSSTVTMLCNSAVLPGHNVMTNEIRYFGEPTERPYGVLYTPITLTFYLDNDLSAKRYFDSWSELVFNKGTRELGYYDTFTRDMEIVVYNKNEEEIERVKLYEAYPKSVSDLQLDYNSSAPMSITVQMVYKWHESWKKDTWKGKTGVDEVPSNEIPQYGYEGVDSSVESLGNSTSQTYSGIGAEMNPTLGFSGSNVSSAFQQAGTNILSDATRSFTQAGNLFNISSITSTQYPNANDLFSSNSGALLSNFGDLAGGISGLGTSPTNITAPKGQIATSLSDLSISLGSLGNLISAVGGNGSELSSLAGNFGSAAANIPTAANIDHMPGHLYSLASNLSASGSAITNSIESLKNVPSFDRTAEIALRNTANTFLNSGSLISGATNFLTEK